MQETKQNDETENATEVAGQDERLVIRPGHGWKHAGGSVYDHNSGLRLHLLGLCRLPSGELMEDRDSAQYRLLSRLIRINGGNRKRGMMAWAMNLIGV